MLVNWDNYPNYPTGGIYTWVKGLIDSMTEYDFLVANILTSPNVNEKYHVPNHVVKVIDMPMYGCYRYDEFYKDMNQKILLKILKTKDKVIKNQFIPLYKIFLTNILSEKCDILLVSDILYKIHEFFLEYDLKKCLEHPLVWKIFLDILNRDELYKHMSLNIAPSLLQIIQRILQIISIDIPKVDLIHCSQAWIPALVALVTKKKWNCPIIVTEHGVAARNLSLYYMTIFPDESSNNYLKLFSINISKIIFTTADIITPVCNANAVWEEILGANRSKIRVIYNGVDTNKFKPVKLSGEEYATRSYKKPTVVYIGRIEPLKDIANLIQSIHYIRNSIPDIQCLIYGSSDDFEYSFKLIEIIKALGLEKNVLFMGKTNQPEKIYNLGEVVVLSSIAEGFPFTVIEAMACGKAVVSTDVGGVREVLEGCGLLVRSRHPIELANSIIYLMKNTTIRTEMEDAALKRIRQFFTIELCIDRYKKLYEEIIEKQKLNRI